jgi:DNA-binding transcriptional ArsR family regulator
MVTANKIAGVAATIGEPARAAMLTALLDGRALTAAELAGVAGVTPQTASAHLSRLIGAELVKVEKQGRHRYHRLASAVVARMLEGLGQHTTGAGLERLTPHTGPRDEAMRRARTCYDHLAGKLRVAIADALVGHALARKSPPRYARQCLLSKYPPAEPGALGIGPLEAAIGVADAAPFIGPPKGGNQRHRLS